ncbi:hypothetical protein [Chromobacterium violaceum]|uniref:hypothetical protein n=1 Tax=Chromobacterium violaceum TaxID=536 RepID=UPI0011C021E9|nr:hypothetical protein [Chromobacterium violaceum]
MDSFVVFALCLARKSARFGWNGNDNGIPRFGKKFDGAPDVARIFVAFPAFPSIPTILRPVSVMPTLD